VFTLLAGAAAAVVAPLLWRRFVQTTNTQVHRINQ
jgi:hypothetical protein